MVTDEVWVQDSVRTATDKRRGTVEESTHGRERQQQHDCSSLNVENLYLLLDCGQVYRRRE